MWQSPPVPPGGVLQLITLDTSAPAEDLWATFAHEVAHAWLIPTAPPTHVTTIRERTQTMALRRRLAAEWHLEHVLIREVASDERQAARLAASWGFVGKAADADACARSAEAQLAAFVL